MATRHKQGVQNAMKKQIDYKQLFKRQQEWVVQLHKLCPELTNESGIYFWQRTVDGEKKMYIGKAKHLMERSVSHCMGYSQRIDLSIRKWGFYDENSNPMGWQLKVRKYPLADLDRWERYYIDYYREQPDVELYNIESGGTTGKTDISTRKSARGYRDGLQQGELKARKYVAQLFAKHLDYSIKGKPTATKQKAFDKFTEYLNATNVITNDTQNGE